MQVVKNPLGRFVLQGVVLGVLLALVSLVTALGTPQYLALLIAAYLVQELVPFLFPGTLEQRLVLSALVLVVIGIFSLVGLLALPAWLAYTLATWAALLVQVVLAGLWQVLGLTETTAAA